MCFDHEPPQLAEADFYIVTVPTPIDTARRPDLSALLSASDTVGKVLKRGDIVVYKSTVYPGTIEEECVPVLEKNQVLRAAAISQSAIRPNALRLPSDVRGPVLFFAISRLPAICFSVVIRFEP